MLNESTRICLTRFLCMRQSSAISTLNCLLRVWTMLFLLSKFLPVFLDSEEFLVASFTIDLFICSWKLSYSFKESSLVSSDGYWSRDLAVSFKSFSSSTIVSSLRPSSAWTFTPGGRLRLDPLRDGFLLLFLFLEPLELSLLFSLDYDSLLLLTGLPPLLS